jgi:hypothetical protein
MGEEMPVRPPHVGGDIDQWKIGIVIRERLGAPIRDMEDRELKEYHDLRAGMKVKVPSLFNGDYHVPIDRIEGDRAYVKGLYAMISYIHDGPDRGWTLLGYMNEDALKMIEF